MKRNGWGALLLELAAGLAFAYLMDERRAPLRPRLFHATMTGARAVARAAGRIALRAESAYYREVQQ